MSTIVQLHCTNLMCHMCSLLSSLDGVLLGLGRSRERVGVGGWGGGGYAKWKKKENEKNTDKSTTIRHCMGISSISTYKFSMHRISCGCVVCFFLMCNFPCGCLYFFLNATFLMALSPIKSCCHNSESNFRFEKMAVRRTDLDLWGTAGQAVQSVFIVTQRKLRNVLWMQCFTHKPLLGRICSCGFYEALDSADSKWQCATERGSDCLCRINKQGS